MTIKLTPEEAIIKGSYPEEEYINGSPLIVSQTVALAQIEHARQEERAKLQQLKNRVIQGDGSPRTVLKENILKWIDGLFVTQSKKGEKTHE